MGFAAENIESSDLADAIKGFEEAMPQGKDIEVPLTLSVGVTMALCGLFLCFVPIPMCQLVGGKLLEAGAAIAGGYLLTQLSDQRRNNKKAIL